MLSSTTVDHQLLQQCHHLRPPLMTTNMETNNQSWIKPAVELAPNCPRCACSNTKFCYYNNYSLSQPRYFCKGCRRYWTKGGSLRNVPVGGGCRKNRRGNKSSVRLSHRQRPASLSNSNSHEDSGSDPSESSNADSAAQQGLDIDMTVVFAKFLNQDAAAAESSGPRDDSVESSESPPSCFEMETVRSGYRQNQSVVVEEFVAEEPRVEDVVVGHDVNEFGLGGLLGEQVEQDVFWSDDSMQTFPWQLPMGCLQELEGFPSDVDDDQLRFSTTNLMNDNWSSLDLYSGFEVFSRS